MYQYVCSHVCICCSRGQTVFQDVKGARGALSFLRPGGDGVGSLGGLWTHGVRDVQDATDGGPIQPLRDAVSVGVLGIK